MDVQLKLNTQQKKEEDAASQRDATSPASSTGTAKMGASFMWPDDEKATVDGDRDEANANANPFRMPSDNEVFVLRDQERKRRMEERQRAKTLKVHQKLTAASKMGSTRLFKDDDPVQGDTEDNGGKQQNDILAQMGFRRDRRREKENMTEFIAKKREMFLVQMSLDTKRMEIKKLEERSQQREEALKKSETLLEEDALKFDAFLKENDMKAVDAIKNAEQQTKLKTEKLQEIKKLTQQIAQIKSEMAKDQEALDDCTKYKDFLEELTDPVWKEEQLEIKRKRQDERRRKRREEKKAREQDESQDEATGEEKRKKKPPKGKSGKIQKEKTQRESDEEYSSGEPLPMYFTKPEQLLDKFLALEENNLFLIQNGQETESQLEELRAKERAIREQMDSETDSLKQQINQLESAIKAENEKAKALEERAQERTGAEAKQQNLEKLSAKIADVYEKCGFDNSSRVGPITMLTNVETCLEDLLQCIETMDPEEFKSAEKAREKDRRQKARAEKMEEQRIIQENKIARSLARAQAPVAKKTGKPLMKRSLPIQKKKKDETQTTKKTTEEEDIKRYFT
eukprot:GFYU01004474.1.p1 GENE.GFYU01004474.1~~GFYU01004474.1.p1  ORF type:complete len:570 (-),score=267.28 GFYU01004474.1:270-1979(-)